MTYGQFLIIFLIAPILALAVYHYPHLERRKLVYIVGLAAIAFLYTPIWDNYLVAEGIWHYPDNRVLGITIGWVPIEEYTFFILQPILLGLWLLGWEPKLLMTQPVPSNTTLRWSAVGLVGVIWIIATTLLLIGDQSFTYMGLILTWALPPVMLQLGFGADILWHQRRLVGFVLTTGTFYLALADTLAIKLGIWTISPQTSLPILLGGILPIEEFLFFFMTTVLVVFGITLLLTQESYTRIHALSQRYLSTN